MGSFFFVAFSTLLINSHSFYLLVSYLFLASTIHSLGGENMKRIASLLIPIMIMEVTYLQFGFQHAVIIGMSLIAGIMSEYMFPKKTI